MANIGIYVGSANGITLAVGEQIQEALGEDNCDLFDLEDDYLGFDEMLEYDVLIFGCSTWGSGEVQFNWVEPLQDLANEKPDFSGKTIALFGAGDYVDHGEQFVSALGVLYDKFTGRGANFIAPFPTDGYTYKYSNAVRDGKFVGFPFDQVNEKDKTPERLGRWLEILKADLA
ncbi:flavodoxin [Marinobacterium lutimaris]|uniref:Flavodoxin n=1 Tax=Marinobacterium lutimaris TaxID=568106 RepID=A0A1H6C6C9_9GAMM|nr:flavodoxin [Marinobacterium lutimaris]SEG68472.1 flavodoxin I [Marinobacterium lutimaris]